MMYGSGDPGGGSTTSLRKNTMCNFRLLVKEWIGRLISMLLPIFDMGIQNPLTEFYHDVWFRRSRGGGRTTLIKNTMWKFRLLGKEWIGRLISMSGPIFAMGIQNPLRKFFHDVWLWRSRGG